MKIELKKVKQDFERKIVKELLDEIENISTDSFMNDGHRDTPSVYYLAIDIETSEFIGVVETYYEVLSEALSLNNFGVKKIFRKKSYGSMFISLLEVEATERGFKQLRLTSHPSSVEFYKRCSFELKKNSDVAFIKNLTRHSN